MIEPNEREISIKLNVPTSTRLGVDATTASKVATVVNKITSIPINATVMR